jgi:hypothetical protein
MTFIGTGEGGKGRRGERESGRKGDKISKFN